MLSLKDLAAQAIPKDAAPVDIHHDIAAIIKHNASVVKKCAHGTARTYRRNKVNGAVTYVCGCVEQWKNGEYVEYVVDCGSSVGSYGCMRRGGGRGRGCRWSREYCI